MEVFEAVGTVLAVRDYDEKPVPPKLVRRIVEAGRLTGSSMNRQPWHFIVVENRDTVRQLGALAQTGPTSGKHRWRLLWRLKGRRFRSRMLAARFSR